jgi:hypothetical protein
MCFVLVGLDAVSWTLADRRGLVGPAAADGATVLHLMVLPMFLLAENCNCTLLWYVGLTGIDWGLYVFQSCAGVGCCRPPDPVPRGHCVEWAGVW